MIGSLRLTREDAPVIAVSTALSVSLAAIFWVAAHHPLAPPTQASQPPATQQHQLHQARTLPIVLHPSQSTPPPDYQVVEQRQTVTTTATTTHRPFPGSSPSPSPRPSPAPSGLCADVLALVHVCVPLGGQP